jgi:uncharacterized protein (DUF2235 family)
VWDTVSSVGWVWNPKRFAYTAQNEYVSKIRHAVSLDERRGFFRQNLFRAAPTQPGSSAQDLVERWFAGFHCDIGGGYGDRCGALWRVAFDWMVAEAIGAGLRVDQDRLATVRSHPKLAGETWTEPTNESLTWKWWLPEFWPKLHWSSRWRRNLPSLGLFRPRRTAGAVLHESVLRRLRTDPRYRPRNLPGDLIQKIRNLSDVAPGATMTVPGSE